MIRIALDAMGGDFAPRETVAGALDAAAAWSDVQILLVGDERAIGKELAAEKGKGAGKSAIEVVHAAETIGMGEHAAGAVRRKRNSSINVAAKLVADKKAEAVVSAGNTGAMVAAATLFMRLLPGVKRPGIAVTLPTQTGRCLLVDAGANIYCKPEHLYQYALMASVFCEQVLEVRRPKVGLLNVGSEEEKGNALVGQTALMLKDAPIHYGGFAEGNDIYHGRFDVIVCEGFVGNTILKVSEGLAESMMLEMKKHLTANPLTLLGALMAKPAFHKIKDKLDYAEYGGAPLLGAQGVAIIAHGRSNARAIRNAIGVAREWAKHDVNAKIIDTLAAFERQ